jgi:DNA mismatch repair ATPase MutL
MRLSENERKSEADATLEFNKNDSMMIQKSEESKTTMLHETEAEADKYRSQIAFECADDGPGLINQSVYAINQDTASQVSTLAPAQGGRSIVDIVNKRLQTIKPYEDAIIMLRKIPQL